MTSKRVFWRMHNPALVQQARKAEFHSGACSFCQSKRGGKGVPKVPNLPSGPSFLGNTFRYIISRRMSAAAEDCPAEFDRPTEKLMNVSITFCMM
jgi:hypothetical protein